MRRVGRRRTKKRSGFEERGEGRKKSDSRLKPAAQSERECVDLDIKKK